MQQQINTLVQRPLYAALQYYTCPAVAIGKRICIIHFVVFKLTGGEVGAHFQPIKVGGHE